MSPRVSYYLVTLACLLAFFVILLGAYTRLTDAGLGCPDWPGCYGHLTAPQNLLSAEQSTKAWTEMIHRYAAMLLGFIILSLSFSSLNHAWKKQQARSLLLPTLLLGTLIFQAALGRWTVTLKLNPLVVMAHLLGGLTLLSLLWILRMKLFSHFSAIQEQSPLFVKRSPQILAFFGLLILAIQITLGVWVSANYAGLACIGFPTCNGELLPSLHFREAFQLPSTMNTYLGGSLDTGARITIQMIHRVGALLTTAYLLFLGSYLILKCRQQNIRQIIIFMLFLCFFQVILGIINVTHLLPLGIAVLHNGTATLLLISLVTLNYHLKNRELYA